MSSLIMEAAGAILLGTFLVMFVLGSATLIFLFPINPWIKSIFLAFTPTVLLITHTFIQTLPRYIRFPTPDPFIFLGYAVLISAIFAITPVMWFILPPLYHN